MDERVWDGTGRTGRDAGRGGGERENGKHFMVDQRGIRIGGANNECKWTCL